MRRLTVIFSALLFLIATLSCGNVLNDMVENLDEHHIWSWTHPSGLDDNISPDWQYAGNHQVAMDNNGNVIIVWMQNDGSNNQIYKSEYRNGRWTHPKGLSDSISPGLQTADGPHVAMDDNGNAVIVWYQNDGEKYQIYKSEYRNGGWTDPANITDNISPDGQDTNVPQIAMDNNGNAVIVWSQFDNVTVDRIYKSEYRNGVWTHPKEFDDNISPDGQYAYDPHVAMDNNGNTVIVWRQSDTSNQQIFKSEYRNGVWTHPHSTDLSDNISPDLQNAYDPQVAMDNNGNTIIVWKQNDTAKQQVFKSEHRNGVWTHPVGLSDNISPDLQHAYDPRIAMDNNGNAIIVWYQNDGDITTPSDQIFKSEYR